MKKKLLISYSLLLVLLFVSCNDIEILSPPGPEGKSAYTIWKIEVEKGNVDWPKDKVEIADFLVYIKGIKGDKGEAGKSAYELWKEMIAQGNIPNPHNPSEYWNKDRDTESDFWDYLTGRDGVSPHIGSNGNWWIGTVDTNVSAKGKDGKDGISAYESWKELAQTGELDDPRNPGNKWPTNKIEVEHFIQYLTGENGKDGSNGKNGDSPHIGSNGNWWIGTIDTNVPAKGKDGSSGVDGKTAYELWIEDVKRGNITDPNTGAVWPSTEITLADFWRYLKGKDGANGTNGLSAYQIWKDLATSGTLDDPKSPNQKWPSTQTSEQDFWLFLMGKDGVKGDPGQNGTHGEPGEDGQSAHALWIAEVEKGIKNPHDSSGGNWPKNETSYDDFWRYVSGKDGQNPNEKERTSLSFVSSTQKMNFEEFVFQTDPGAKVTMNYKSTTVSGTADASGLCTLSFPNSKTEDLPVIVYAEATNKKESYPISVKVRIDGRSSISFAFTEVKWYDGNNNLLDNRNENHGQFIDGDVPYYSFKNSMNGYYITIPFESSGIKNITFTQSGGFSQLNITSELNVTNDYSSGIVKIKHTGGVWMAGSIEVTMTAEANDGSIITNKIIVEPKMF